MKAIKNIFICLSLVSMTSINNISQVIAQDEKTDNDTNIVDQVNNGTVVNNQALIEPPIEEGLRLTEPVFALDAVYN